MKALCFLLLAPLVVGMAIATAGCGGIASSSSNGGDASNEAGASNDTGAPDGGGTFPLGAYSDCQWLVAGDTFESTSSPATLTLSPVCSASGCSASSIVASFQSGQTTNTLMLRATSDSSAALNGPGQGFPGAWGFCGGGAFQVDGGVVISDPVGAQATLSMTSAELTVDQGVAFLQVDGQVVDVQGSPGCNPDTPPSAGLSVLLVCDVSTGNGAGNPPATAATTSRFATGAYDCYSGADSVVTYQGVENHSSVGGSGTLTLTANGAGLEAVYGGDTNATGTLDFVVTSDSSANPAPGQTMTVGCGAFDPTTSTQVNAPTVADVTAAALTTDGTAVYLTFLSKTSGGACPDQTASTVLMCTPKG